MNIGGARELHFASTFIATDRVFSATYLLKEQTLSLVDGHRDGTLRLCLLVKSRLSAEATNGIHELNQGFFRFVSHLMSY